MMAAKSKTTLEFCLGGQQAGQHARGDTCEHVMGFGGLKTHAGRHVHIHPSVCLGLSVHPWMCPQEWDVQKGVFVFVHRYSAVHLCAGQCTLTCPVHGQVFVE